MLIIKSGELFTVDGAREVRYASQFIAEKIEIAERSERFSGWKGKEDADGGGGLVPRAMLWGGRRAKAQPPEIILAQERGDGFYFVVRMSRSAGLFFYDRTKDEEIRFFHKEGFEPAGLAVDGRGIVTTVDASDGSRHIVAYDADGRNEAILTSGDSLDEHPSIAGDEILYDSRGIGRAQDGSIGAYGPRGLYAVGRDGQGHRTLRESPTYDYLMPKRAADGTVYALRIPHDDGGYSLWRSCKDLAMFPVVMAMAVIGFLNTFALMFAKKPIIAHGGPRTPEQDLRRRLIHAKVVDIERASREAGRRVAAPKAWKLVRLDGEADVEVAGNAVGYDLLGGEVLVNTGFAIQAGSGRELYASREIITGLAAS